MKMMQSLSRYMQLPVYENRLVVKWTLADPLFLCGSILWSASTLPHATTFNNINITLWIAVLINYHRPCFFRKIIHFRFVLILNSCCFPYENDEIQTQNPLILWPCQLCFPQESKVYEFESCYFTKFFSIVLCGTS